MGNDDLASNSQDISSGPRERESLRVQQLQQVLAQYDITSSVLHTSETYRPLVTQTRTRTVIRSTPTGGAIIMEVEEEVG